MERVEVIGAAAAVGVVAALVGLGVVLLALRRDLPPPVRGLLRAVALSLAAAFLAHLLLLTRLSGRVDAGPRRDRSPPPSRWAR